MFRNRKNKTPRKNSGQGTVEYIILVTAVIAVVILFVTNKNQGFQKKLADTYNNATEGMTNRADYLASKTHTTPPATGPGQPPQIEVDITE